MLIPSMRKRVIGTGPGLRATLELDFINQIYAIQEGKKLVQKTFNQLFAFSRTTIGGVWNSLGVYELLDANTPRFSFDPTTKTTSTTQQLISTGRKTFTVNNTYRPGQVLRATATTNNYMTGVVIAATSTRVTVAFGFIVGSGQYSAWTLIQPKGLLSEEIRTNLCLYSNTLEDASWIKTLCTVAPEGTAPIGVSYKVTPINSGAHFLTKNFTANTGTTYCSWRVLKAGALTRLRAQLYATPLMAQIEIDLVAGTVTNTTGIGNITPLGDGWYLVCMTAVSPISGTITDRWYPVVGGSTGFEADGISGYYQAAAQIEAGYFPTSYIPTLATAQGRGFDNITIPINSDWFNVDEGTLACEFSQDYAGFSINGIGRRAVSLNGGAADYLDISRGNTGLVGVGLVTGGVSQTAFPGSAVADRQPARCAISYKTNDMAASINSGSPVYDTTASLFTPTILAIGQRGKDVAHLSGEVQTIKYNPRRLDPQTMNARA